MNKSIEKRLLYCFTAISAIVLIAVSLGLSYVINNYFWESRKRDMIVYGKNVSAQMTGMLDKDPDYISGRLRAIDSLRRMRIWFIDTDKKLVASSVQPTELRPAGKRLIDSQAAPPDHNRPAHGDHDRGRRHAEKLTIEADSAPERRRSFEKIQTMLDAVFTGKVRHEKVFHPYFRDDVLAVGIPVKDKNDKIVGALLLNAPILNAQKFMTEIYHYIALVGILAIMLSWILAKMLSARLVKPLIDMRESAAAMAHGDYTGRIVVKGEDEVADLAKSLNSLAQDLADFVDQTERMEQLRRDFVANVSHELRTPVTIIRGYNEAMLDGTVTDKEKIERYQTLIRDETVRLEGLVRELLDISRLQARVEKDFETVPLDNVVKEVKEKLSVKAQEKDITLTVDVDGESYINALGARIVQLVMILADNAIKYTNAGGYVKLSAKKQLDGKICLSVEDNGIGIAPSDQEMIWERFYKADKSHSKAIGGTGLGLAIAKEIIQMHKAECLLESEPGKGTAIKVLFDAAGDF